MDVNLTGLVATNTTLIQPWYNGPIIGAAGVIIGAAVAGGLTLIRDILKNRLLEKQRKHWAYGQLMGRKSMLLQSYASYYGAFIRSEMLDCRSTLEAFLHRLDGMEPIEIENMRTRSIEFTEGIRAKIRSEDLQLQIAKSDERFWATISQIEILFSRMSDLNENILLIREAENTLARLERDIVNSGRDFKESVFDEAQALSGPTLTRPDPAAWALNRQTELMTIFNSFDENVRDYSEDLESKINELLDYLKTELVEPNRIEVAPGYNDPMYRMIIGSIIAILVVVMIYLLI